MEYKRNVRDIAKAAYDFRSSIVHGTPEEPIKIRQKLSRLDIWNPADLTKSIENYAREALRRLVLSPDLGDPKSLDDRLLF